MNLNRKQFITEVAGRTLTLETSDLAGQANAAVLGTYGDTSVLVAVTMGKEERNTDYFPLTVDYEERFYAAGKILGSRFIRREGRPSEEAVLSGRLIDRTLRPLFDQRLRRDVQVVITILSYDEENDADFIGLITASAALAISDIPWNGPVAGTRLARFKDGKTEINPLNSSLKEKENIAFEAFVSGAYDKINMIELAGNETQEKEVIESFKIAHEEMKKLIAFQKDVVSKIGKQKIEFKFDDLSELKGKVREFLKGKLEEAVYVSAKTERQNNLDSLKKDLKVNLAEGGVEDSFIGKVDAIFEGELDILVHAKLLQEGKRPDGRKNDELRPLYGEVGLFRRLHGSALFQRGDTQSLAVVTLAPPGSEQLVESMELSYKRRFMLHYNFPPYSTGETGRLGGPGRREIGHGALAEKALRSMLPSQDEFPYTIRVVSEILSSNGSSSMATTCASSLALMDAGVPIKKPVAGIAMGLMSDKEKYKILTDIQGPEDHYGDMDCKIAGTTEGITAIQMDVKIEGVTADVLGEVFEQSKKARLEILGVMKSVIEKPRAETSAYAPSIISMQIDPEQIGEVIGPGGKVINGIISSTGALSIDVEQTGKVFVAGATKEIAKAAAKQIEIITHQFQIGEIVEGEIIKIMEFGAIVGLGGGRDGMIHVSELKNGFVQKVEDVVRLGDVVRVKVVKVENGRIGLSLKAMGGGKE
ncbi:MAG: polyribonucleotide nucleotidyltransferase [Spirochaetia bacterium]|nr:MAG: polyribonucleotide nucleotidyltransferase [Spirochaetia bacterium]